MPRLTSLLERVMYKRPITPIIVKTPRIEEIRAEILQLLPLELKDVLKRLFPRVTVAAETALATLNVIPEFNMISFPASTLIIEELAQDRRIEKIYLDRMMTLHETVPGAGRYYDRVTKKVFTSTMWTKKIIGVDKANASGYTGRGISIAVIDTGGTPLHVMTPHLELYSTMRGLYSDRNGHGEHVASTVGGKFAIDPRLRVECEGMAPEARLISIKCLGYVIGFGKESDILEALSLAYRLEVDVVNMSLGTEEVPPSPEEDPYSEVITKLTGEGIMVVVSAGNSGSGSGSINVPGACEDAITVGAWDELEGRVADFSSRGPVWGMIKPDIIAPGIEIHSGITGLLDIQGDKKKQKFSYLSGTSMSAPHVSGLLACAKQMFNEAGVPLNTEVVKSIFEEYGEPKDNERGWGLANWRMFEQYISEHFK